MLYFEFGYSELLRIYSGDLRGRELVLNTRLALRTYFYINNRMYRKEVFMSTFLQFKYRNNKNNYM